VCLVVTELPRVPGQPRQPRDQIADLVKEGKLAGIATSRTKTSGRTGQRLVIVLKRDAVAKVVLNKPLQAHPAAERTSAGQTCWRSSTAVPRTRAIDGIHTRRWIEPPESEVIVRSHRVPFGQGRADAHIQRGYVKALDALDEVIALIRRSTRRRGGAPGTHPAPRLDRAAGRRHLALTNCASRALEPQKIQEPPGGTREGDPEYESILASESRQRQIIVDELSEIVRQVRR